MKLDTVAYLDIASSKCDKEGVICYGGVLHVLFQKLQIATVLVFQAI
jgi:hypothetical protein